MASQWVRRGGAPLTGELTRHSALARRRQITALVREHGSVRAADLRDMFGVTDETIRRDLNALAESGVLRRLHGGAVSDRARTESSFARRLREHEAEKRAIARVAAEGVSDGSTIIIDSGTTMVHFVRALRGKRDLVVITTAVTNAAELMEYPGVTVVLTGGVVRPATFGAVGDMAVSNLSELRVDQTYLAINGITVDGGLTYPNFEEAAVKRAMIAAAAETILLADHSKFGRDALVRVAPLTAMSRIITSPGVDPAVLHEIGEAGVDVVVAPEALVGSRDGADAPWPDADGELADASLGRRP